MEEFTCPNIESTTSIETTVTTTYTTKQSPLITLLTNENNNFNSISDILVQQENSHLIPIITSHRQNEETPQSSPSQIQITNATLPPADLSYYSLIVGISLSISFICLLILVIFYLFCLNTTNNKNDMNNYDDSSETTKKYLNDFLNSNSIKYDFKFCSPPLSSSSSSTTSSTSTSSSIAYSKNSSKCLDMSMDIFQTNFTNVNENNHHQVKTGCIQCPSTNLNNPYNHLNNSIFSINLQQQQQQLNNDTHIYHEINTPSKVTRSNNLPLQSHFLYENNLNYLVMPSQSHPTAISTSNTNTLLFKNCNNNNNTNTNAPNYRCSNLVNDFTNSLFV